MNDPRQGAWPVKTREMHNHHMDSTAWNKIVFRPDDIVIATYGKAGTTWMQQIVAQLVFGGRDDIDVSTLSPWVDMRIMPPETFDLIEGFEHRRFLKTHLPVDALAFSPMAKYLYVARDGRDTLWSMYNHHVNFKPHLYDALNNAPGRVGPPLEPPPAILEYYRRWMAEDGYPFWPFWAHIRSWWAVRDLPNVQLIHFNELKADLPGTIRRIAAFLDIAIDEAVFPAIVEHCTFDYMKAHAELAAPLRGEAWEGGAKTFINKGTNGRWRDTLTAQDVRDYQARALAELGPECTRWLTQPH